MFAAGSLNTPQLDIWTLSIVAVCVVATLGILLLFAWLRQRDVRALAWWGSAYLIGAGAIALWSSPEYAERFGPGIPQALAFIACGMIWNGVRLFHQRPLLPLASFLGAAIWLMVSSLSAFPQDGTGRVLIGALVVTCYTFAIARELWGERRKSLFSRTAAIIVPCLHAAIFLTPLLMRALLPEAAANWTNAFALETIIYAVGAAFIVLVMVNDQHVHIYRTAATTDYLTMLLNRRAFLDHAKKLCDQQGRLGEPVTLMMFDLDHFKSINDRFGHAVGDDTLREFAKVARTNMRENDIIGRLGGEEFAAIVPGSSAVATLVAERLRAAFQTAGVMIGPHAIGATVSIGAATSYETATDIDALIIRADNALYEAKRSGRNRLHLAEDEPSSELARLRYAARMLKAAKEGKFLPRKYAARRRLAVRVALSG
jgi:diguanylate cyclase (GGDEF)-like protein